MIPNYLATFSLLILVSSLAWDSNPPHPRGHRASTQLSKSPVGLRSYILEGTRLASLVLLLGLSIAAAIYAYNQPRDWRLEAAQCALYVCFISPASAVVSSALIIDIVFPKVYILLLSVMIRRDPTWTSRLAYHRRIIMLATLAVFTYRDLWPLATFDQSPTDGQLGWMAWARVALVFYCGAIVPLVLPGVYVAVDPEVPISLQPYQSDSGSNSNANTANRTLFRLPRNSSLRLFRYSHMGLLIH